MDVFGSTLESERIRIILNLEKINMEINNSLIRISMRMDKHTKEIQILNEELNRINADFLKKLSITESAIQRIVAEKLDSRIRDIEKLLPPKFSSNSAVI